MARGLVAAGLLPALGVHHSNELNAFALADDLMEPFRPVVDLLVAQSSGYQELNSEYRKHILTILGVQVRLGEEHLSIINAAEAMSYSYVAAMKLREPSRFLVPILREVSPDEH